MIMVLMWHMSVLVKFARVILHDVVVVVVMLLLLLLLLLRLENLSLCMIPISQYTHGAEYLRCESPMCRGSDAIVTTPPLLRRQGQAKGLLQSALICSKPQKTSFTCLSRRLVQFVSPDAIYDTSL
jgi:hypothetical protein